MKNRGFDNPLTMMQAPVIPIISDDNMETVPEETALWPNGNPVAPEGTRFDLAFFRAMFPFMPIMPWHDNIITVICTAANTSYDINLPDGTGLVKFSADGPDFWLSSEGNAAVPTAAIIAANPGGKLSAYAPTDYWHYTGATRQFSVCSATAGRIVQARCYLIKERPLT